MGYNRVGNSGSVSNANDRLIRQPAHEVERNPDILPIIERRNPTLASALEQISPRLKAIAAQEAGASGEQPQTF